MSAKSAEQLPRVPGIAVGDLKEEDVIGQGTYATVYRIEHLGRLCTAKKIHRTLLQQDSKKSPVVKRFRDECALLSRLRHPNIVHFLGVIEEAKQLVLVAEWLPVDLRHAIDQYLEFPLSVKLSLLQDVSYGLLYLHSMKPDPIVHRDLTASNVLVTRDLRAKIADLGMSRAIDMSPQKLASMTKCPGAMAYMPPEALAQKPVYGPALDVFSFGHLSLLLVNQVFPNVDEVTFSESHRAKGIVQVRGGHLEF